MLNYRCTLHNIPLKSSTCQICNSREHVETKSDLYWCPACQVPIYNARCPVCQSKGKRVATDLRPVFPQERLLVEIVWGMPLKYKDSSVWNTSGNSYLIDGTLHRFAVKELAELDPNQIREQLEQFKEQNRENNFAFYMERFIVCNRDRLSCLEEEAISYLKKVTDGYDLTDMFVSFSGGKDSTVTSDLVMRALNSRKVLHIFGDTTLEFPETAAYVERFRQEHKTPVISSRNREKNFEELCELIGPPSRVMRWCCTIFKTGAINRKITALFPNKNKILAFYGIRRSESASRSKYERESQGAKISKQVTISPIIDWMDFDIWLYLLSHQLDFNDAYRLGYARVGCWCCPNNSAWSEFLSRIYMPETYKKWHDFLVSFAETIGKPDAKEYIETGKWKARQGGNGISYASRSFVSFTPCALEENSYNYELQRPITDEFYELFKPFGYLDKTLGISRLGEVYVKNRQGELVLKLQGRVGSRQLKVTILNVHLDGANNLVAAEEKIRCQLTKYQLCMGCRACEGVCRQGAITVETDKENQIHYYIQDEKCTRCGQCVNHFIAGCYMRKVLATKENRGNE